MGHLLYLIFRCDFDVMKSLDFWGFLDLNTPLQNNGRVQEHRAAHTQARHGALALVAGRQAGGKRHAMVLVPDSLCKTAAASNLLLSSLQNFKFLQDFISH